MTTILASTLVATAEADKIERAIAKIKAETTEKYDQRIEMATLAIKYLEPMFHLPATEENILQARKLIITTRIDTELVPDNEDSVIEAMLVGAFAGALNSGVSALSKITKGGGVEGMIKRFDLNARASLEARTGTLTIGKLLKLQPEIIILCLK